MHLHLQLCSVSLTACAFTPAALPCVPDCVCIYTCFVSLTACAFTPAALLCVPDGVCIYTCSSEYMEPFERRDLQAFSAEPLLVYPTHYTGDDGYVSDTETSTVWDNEEVRTDWDRARSRKTQEQEELSSDAQNTDVLQSALDSTARDEL